MDSRLLAIEENDTGWAVPRLAAALGTVGFPNFTAKRVSAMEHKCGQIEDVAGFSPVSVEHGKKKKMFPNSFHMFLVFRCHDSGCVQGGVSLPRHRSQWVEKWWWHFMTSWCGCFGPVYIFIVYPFFLTSTMHQQQRSAKITVRGMTLSLLQTSETSPRTCQELLKNGQNQH